MSRYQKGKTNLDFTEARDSEWQWHQLGHMQVCTSRQTDNHASTPLLSFLQVGCSSCRPTNSVKALKATTTIDAWCWPGSNNNNNTHNVEKMCYAAETVKQPTRTVSAEAGSLLNHHYRRLWRQLQGFVVKAMITTTAAYQC